ncbi:MAG: 4Fe-4S binding protein [Phycisphaerales bacterium]|jgi:ferredoxin|nr:4Fe-4S binding protein [Phycisphaerales bacterium]
MSKKQNGEVSLTVIQKRNHSSLRWSVLIAVQILILIHIASWLLGKHFGWFGGKTLTPIEPSEGMELVKNGIINAGAIFFILAILSTVIFGRWFCGWGCHIVLLQDFCYWLMRKVHVRPKPFRSRLLLWFPLGLACYMYLWPLFYRIVIAPIYMPDLKWPGFTTHLFTDDYWNSFGSPIIAIPFLLVCGFATVYVLGAKGFCSYGCPYGGFFKPADSISPTRVRVNDNCQECGKCTAACTSNVRVHEEINIHKMVVDSGCMKILDCVDACPNNALYVGYGSVALGKKLVNKKHDLTLFGEICVSVLFLIGFFAFRGLYASIPMLMAVGMSLVTTWLIWKSTGIFGKQNSSFHKHQLRFHGKIKIAGIIFLCISTLTSLFLLQSILVWSFRYIGDSALSNEQYDEALYYYKLSGPLTDGGVGLASNPNVDLIMSRIYEGKGDFSEAERLLWRIDSRVGMDERSTMFLGQIMQFHQQFGVIDSFYEERLTEEPKWNLAWEDYVGWLKREGFEQDAIKKSKKANRLNPKSERLQIQLVLLEIEFGNVDNAVYLATEMTINNPNSPNPWMLLSRAFHKQGKHSEAIEAQNKAAKIQGEKIPLR